MLEGRLQAAVNAVAVAQVEEEVSRAERWAGVVNQLTGRGQAVWLDFKLLPLWDQTGQQSYVSNLQLSPLSGGGNWKERAYQEGEAAHVRPGEVVQLLTQVVHLLLKTTATFKQEMAHICEYRQCLLANWSRTPPSPPKKRTRGYVWLKNFEE